MSARRQPAEPNPTALRPRFRRVLHMLTGKWKLEIMWQLHQRTHRFGELKRAIPGITQHMLTAQLRELEADGLVLRRVFAEVPVRVEYELSALALSLKPVFAAIIAWCEAHPSALQPPTEASGRRGKGGQKANTPSRPAPAKRGG
jgi:DNA-binding HxlR family transcriptional regulator